MKIRKIILGSFMVLSSIVIAFSSTYLYDYFEGHKGREFISLMFGLIFTVGLLSGGIALIIDGADNHKSK